MNGRVKGRDVMDESVKKDSEGSTPLFTAQELVWRPDVLSDIVHTDMRLDGCNLYSGRAPELGLELDVQAVCAHPYSPQALQILRREDTSLSDWYARPPDVR
jgi:galactonate dehydratase